jgi:hypothetical protein
VRKTRVLNPPPHPTLSPNDSALSLSSNKENLKDNQLDVGRE